MLDDVSMLKLPWGLVCILSAYPHKETGNVTLLRSIICNARLKKTTFASLHLKAMRLVLPFATSADRGIMLMFIQLCCLGLG